jgi:hypothetical protein
MPTIPLSPGETFVLSKKNNVPYIKSSTDSVEQNLFIRNDIQLTGSAATGTTIFNNGYIELTNTNSGQDPYIVFKPSTVALQNFVLGYDDSQNRFALGTGNTLASTTANRVVFHVHSGSRILHVDEGLVVTGSIEVPNSSDINASIVNNNFVFYNTSDSNLTVDAAVTQSLAWVSSFTANRALFITNLTKGRKFEAYIQNTNASSRTITFSGSINTSGGEGLALAKYTGAWGNSKTIDPLYGAAYIHVQNFGTATNSIFGSIT